LVYRTISVRRLHIARGRRGNVIPFEGQNPPVVGNIPNRELRSSGWTLGGSWDLDTAARQPCSLRYLAALLDQQPSEGDREIISAEMMDSLFLSGAVVSEFYVRPRRYVRKSTLVMTTIGDRCAKSDTGFALN
jgi:hypothetical protein